MDPWEILDTYFQDHRYPFTKHHLDSFREFLRTYIPNTIRSYNPLIMVKDDDAGNEILRVQIYIGGKDGKRLLLERPTILDEEGKSILLTPQEARLRNMTYGTHIFADILVEYFKDGATAPTTKEFPMTYIGSVPLMLHSEPCILHGQGAKVLQSLGECPMDPGGYFVIDGKEKVIVSQERITTNRLFIEPSDDPNYAFKAMIRCTGSSGETALSPRTVEFYLIREPDTMIEADVKEDFRTSKGAILVSLPSMKGHIPLTTLFRALGIESDRQIVELICGPVEDANLAFLNFLRPSLVQGAAKGVMTQKEALEYLRVRTLYESVANVRSILAIDLFPNIPDSLSTKAVFLGYLVNKFMKTALGMLPPSDRDSYIFKRVDISGFLLSQLFQEVYDIFRKHVRDQVDQEYYYGPWKNTGSIEDIVRVENLHRLFPGTMLTETFARSLKGMWGSSKDDVDQGKVQDLARISYIGFLSHLRRVNLPLDRSIKVTSPHRLHSQQWGIMCPFESPDGASIGYLKNFALMTQITFGTSEANIIQCLEDLEVTPIAHVPPRRHMSQDTVRVFLNGLYYGITSQPQTVVRALRIFRRTGLLNPFVSVAWNILENEIRIQTEAGRPCRPVLIIENGEVIFKNVATKTKQNWFSWVFGSLLSEDERTNDGYYMDKYRSPFNMMEYQGRQLVEVLKDLERKQACIEFLDIEEENTMYVAMKEADVHTFHTHLEIHPSTIFSVVTHIVPFANHNQAPRVIFHGAQSKQAIGIYATNFTKRFDTMGYIQHYPQKRIVTTRGSYYNGSVKMPNGCNVIVAVAAYTGFNQEDAIIINKSSVDRGLFQITAYKTMTASEKTLSPQEMIVFSNPIRMREEGKMIHGGKHANYTLLDDQGIIKEEAYIPRGQKAVVLGMMHVRKNVKDEKRGVFTDQVIEETYHDVSLSTDVHHYGKVDRVFVATQNQGTTSRIAKVRFRKIRRPELGDKHCLTPEHEALTTKGWKPIADVTKNDEVYVLKADGSFGYEKPYALYQKDCNDEDIYVLESQQVDLRVTMDHNMWVKKRNSKQYEIIKARDVVGKRVSYAKSAKNSNEYSAVLFDTNTIKEIYETLSIPEYVWKLGKKEARELCDILIPQDQLSTTSRILANDIQRLALHAEWSATIKKNDINYVVHVVKANNEHVAMDDQETIVKYTGKVYCIEVPSHVFYVRKNGKPVWTGNCSAHGQKGVCGMLLPHHEMPFTKDGVVPDLIINPHAFPSRMTIGHLVETVTAKLCCLQGSYADGTVFMPFDQEDVYSKLEQGGFERHGNEILYNGRTGQQIATEIFMGPIYYYRLKHMVTDKIHARGDGPKVLLTHQPTSGRSKQGGLRIGEMERDVLLGHGLAQFAKEHMMEKSDKYRWALCRCCGTVAKYNPSQNISECSGCNGHDVAIVTTPYAFKLLIQEMEAMGVQIRLSDMSPPDEDDDEQDLHNIQTGGNDEEETDETPEEVDEQDDANEEATEEYMDEEDDEEDTEVNAQDYNNENANTNAEESTGDETYPPYDDNVEDAIPDEQQDSNEPFSDGDDEDQSDEEGMMYADYADETPIYDEREGEGETSQDEHKQEGGDATDTKRDVKVIVIDSKHGGDGFFAHPIERELEEGEDRRPSGTFMGSSPKYPDNVVMENERLQEDFMKFRYWKQMKDRNMDK